MNRYLVWGITGFFVFLLFIASIAGTSVTVSEYEGYIGSNEWMWPVPDCRTISSPFGYRTSPTAGASSNHKGIDIACQMGTYVVASKAGTVIVAEETATEGKWIAIQHDDTFMSYYMHNSELLVKVGDKVVKGQVIALSGNTGISSGPHLHFAILKNNEYLDPLRYVSQDEKIEKLKTQIGIKREAIVEYAKRFIGNVYVYGGTSLTNGVDCSGFTMRIYEHFGITIPRVAQDQYNAAEKIQQKDLLPGDLVFYGDSSGSITHVAMYIGNNKIVHASNSKPYPEGGIKISDMTYQMPCGYGRYIIASDYTNEDLQYMAACIAAEALSNSPEGQAAVGYCVMNRVEAQGFGQSVKEVVTAKNQFNSPWRNYLSGAPGWAEEAAKRVLEGSVVNPIGSRCFFISADYARSLGIENRGINVGNNVFYDRCEW